MASKNKTACACFCIFIALLICFLISVAISDHIIPPQRVTITSANLNRFELPDVGSTTSTSLYYDLAFTLSIRNTVWHATKAEYRDMEVDCYYNTERFDWLVFGDFVLTARTRLFNFSRTGSSVVNLGSSDVDKFRKSNATGVFDLTIWLKGVRRYLSDDGDSTHQHLSYQCRLNLQLITSQNNNTELGNFQPVKCS